MKNQVLHNYKNVVREQCGVCGSLCKTENIVRHMKDHCSHVNLTAFWHCNEPDFLCSDCNSTITPDIAGKRKWELKNPHMVQAYADSMKALGSDNKFYYKLLKQQKLWKFYKPRKVAKQ